MRYLADGAGVWHGCVVRRWILSSAILRGLLATVFWVVLWAGAGPQAFAEGPHVIGRLASDALSEISGAVVAQSSPPAWWVLNDGGHPAVLFRIGAQGRISHRVHVVGHRNVDWEDLAQFTWFGKRYLLIADTGDNDAVRREVALLVVALPDLPAPPSFVADAAEASATEVVEVRARTVRRVRLQYPEGARDVESVSVDPVTQKVLLLSKRDTPPRLYSVPLQKVMGVSASAAAKTLIEPQFEGALSAISDHFKTPFFSALLGFALTRPTAMDAVGDPTSGVSRLAVLTYGYVYLFDKRAEESYRQAFSREPVVIHLRQLPQAEALALSSDGRTVTVFSEGVETPFLRWALPELHVPDDGAP